ncbi:terminase small subunit [Ensifer sp. SSB1]|uniref:terminase small subunit n=1 Tax=Ensifer sp. SSB1 TaxID=2795385 RepID=UPI001A4FF0B6|nr:terminase small subunit [Ensifer sp. SSB1]MBK5570110.1 terminase small subunit [Ensifer sp. SSB1]
MAGAAKLTPKQERFVAEYLIDLNATQAAIRAGYSAKTAQEQGSRLLSNVMVAEAIQAAMKAREERTEITQDRVLLELSRIAFFDPRKLLRDDGSPKPIGELDDGTAAALAGLEITEEWEGSGEDRVFVGYTKKYKISDKNTAITNAMRHLGMFVDKSEVSAPGGKPLFPQPTGVLVVPGAMSVEDWESMMAKQEGGA